MISDCALPGTIELYEIWEGFGVFVLFGELVLFSFSKEDLSNTPSNSNSEDM